MDKKGPNQCMFCKYVFAIRNLQMMIMMMMTVVVVVSEVREPVMTILVEQTVLVGWRWNTLLLPPLPRQPPLALTGMMMMTSPNLHVFITDCVTTTWYLYVYTVLYVCICMYTCMLVCLYEKLL